MKKCASLVASSLFATLFFCTFCAAEDARYFKAEHGVGATYVELAVNGQYKVIDREHMGVFLTDTKKDLDADPNHLPGHVRSKITAKTYSTERKETYPFRYIGPKQ